MPNLKPNTEYKEPEADFSKSRSRPGEALQPELQPAHAHSHADAQAPLLSVSYFTALSYNKLCSDQNIKLDYSTMDISLVFSRSSSVRFFCIPLTLRPFTESGSRVLIELPI